MSGERLLVFAPFSLDMTNGCLLRGSTRIPLRPKSFELLRYLLEHPARLVTKAELLNAVWPNTKVVDTVLKVGIWDIRHALEDAVAAPKFIEAVGRKGYRFIAPIVFNLPGGTFPSTPIWLVDPLNCSNSAVGSKPPITQSDR
jgi:DNA-binding winged helix-turn-helix (wHTH) protein